MLAAAAVDVAGIGSSLSEANAAAAASTTRVIPAAADEVSVAIASLFSSHGTGFQALSAQATAFHSRFVQALNAGAGAYASTEAANAGPLNVAVSVLGFPLVQLGSAHAFSGFGGLAVAVGANSDATTGVGIFNCAFALGAGSDATVIPPNQFDTAIAIGANDVAVAGGGSPSNFPNLLSGSFDTAFVLGTGSDADATYGNYNLAAVFGNMQTATATGNNRLVDIVTPFGTL
jgi:hypothetical protein